MRERFFFLCSFFLNQDSSFEVSVDGHHEASRYFRIKRSAEYDVFRSAIDFEDSISLIHTIASIGRLGHEASSLSKFVRQILKFLNSFLFSGTLCLSPLFLAPPPEHSNFARMSQYLQAVGS